MFAATNMFLTAGTAAATGQPVGLSSSLLSLSGQNNQWHQNTIDISSYGTNTVRFVVKYTSGPSFRADFQIDDVTIDGTTYNFESHATGWQTTRATSNGQTFSNYSTVTWYDVYTQTSRGRWNRDRGGTGSSGTGLTTDHTLGTTSGYYLYTEATSRFNTDFWLRSPEITLSGSPGNLTFWEARYGSNMGSSQYYLDVTA